MNTNKLREAIAEMETERSLLDDAMGHIRLAIAILESAPSVAKSSPHAGPRSYIDEAAEFITASGKPMHARDLVEHISASRGVAIGRGSVESSIVRHIDKATAPRLARFGPSTFGLAEWKQQYSALTQ